MADNRSGTRRWRTRWIGILSSILLVVLMTAPAKAAMEWTQADMTHHALYTTLLLADWKQTRDIAKNPNRFYEVNPILGTHPPVAVVDYYFIATWLTNTLVTYSLPPEKRRAWQSLWISFEKNYIASNVNIGLTLTF